MRIVTRDFNVSHHRYWMHDHDSSLKRHLKHAAHHRERAALRAAFARHDWETAQSPVLTRPATSWDIC